ncbi:MAG: hypothetical protein OEO79_07865 [Gemmatimonadota bacterium]|nr:hypothetical protein [Gemmatimonadota bacterium]
MSDSNKAIRVYSEAEVGKILKRATELHQTERSGGSGEGMTLAELEDVAAEAGIDVGRVRRAALEVETDGAEATAWSGFLGDDLSIAREITLPGEVPERDFEGLLGVVQGSVREHGHSSLIGRTLSWQGTAADGGRKLRVLVTSRDGATQIQVHENFSQMAGGLFGGIGGGVGIGAGVGGGMPIGLALGSPALAIALPVATLGITYLGVRALYRSIVQRRRRVLDDLFGRLVEEAETSISASGSDGP